MGSQGQCSTLRALGRCRLAVSVSSSRWEMKGPYSVLVNRRGPSCPPGPSLLEACGCRAFPKLEQGSSNRRFLPAFLVSSNSAQAYWGGATATSRPCAPGSAWLMLCLSVPGFTRLMQCTRNLERTFLSVPTPPPTPLHLHLHLQAAAAAAPAATAAPTSGHLPCQPCLGKFLVSHVHHHHLRILGQSCAVSNTLT